MSNMQEITLAEYFSRPSERDMAVRLNKDNYRLGATVGRITQIFLHAFDFGGYVVQEGSDIVWVSDNYGNPKSESIFRI